MHRLHSNSFSDFAVFYRSLLQVFLRRRRKALDFFQLVAAQTCLQGIKKKKKKKSKERAERDLKYWCKRCRRVNHQFLCSECDFLLEICVKKSISMKILVLRVINSLRHRNCFLIIIIITASSSRKAMVGIKFNII